MLKARTRSILLGRLKLTQVRLAERRIKHLLPNVPDRSAHVIAVARAAIESRRNRKGGGQ